MVRQRLELVHERQHAARPLAHGAERQQALSVRGQPLRVREGRRTALQLFRETRRAAAPYAFGAFAIALDADVQRPTGFGDDDEVALPFDLHQRARIGAADLAVERLTEDEMVAGTEIVARDVRGWSSRRGPGHHENGRQRPQDAVHPSPSALPTYCRRGRAGRHSRDY